MNLTNRLELIGSDGSSQPSPLLPCSSPLLRHSSSLDRSCSRRNRSFAARRPKVLALLSLLEASSAALGRRLPLLPLPEASLPPAAGVALPLVPDNLGEVHSAGSRAPDDLAGRQLRPAAAGGSASPCDERRRERWTEESTGEEERAGWMIRSNRLGEGKMGSSGALDNENEKENHEIKTKEEIL